MPSTPKPPEDEFVQKFAEAANNWDLEKLYTDLAAAKQQQNSGRRKGLTPIEKACLRGLLCGFSPNEIATELHRQPNGLRVELTRGLYRYIETLTLQPPDNYRNVSNLLERAGYKTRLANQSQQTATCEETEGFALPQELAADFAFNNGWVGRKELIAHLSAKLRGTCRVLILTGITGIGKTAIAEQLSVELRGDWLEFFRVNFDNQENTDFASVAAELLTGWQDTVTPEERKEPQRLLSLLVSRLRENRYLVLIDSLELILKGNAETGWSDFQDEWWEKFFQSLLSAESCQSRIILTSQDLPGQLETVGLRYSNFWHCQSLRGLTELEQLELFEKTGLEVSTQSPAINYLKRIGAAYEGHPLALRVIAGEIASQPFNGNVVAYWKQYAHEVEEVEQSQQQAEEESPNDQFRLDRYTRCLQRAVKQRIEKTFERLAKDVFIAYVLVCCGSVYRRPVSEKFYLNILERLGFNKDKQQAVLDALRDRYLIEEELINDDLLLRQHNLIRSVALIHSKNLKVGEKST